MADRQVDRRVRGGAADGVPPGRAQRHPLARRARRRCRVTPGGARARRQAPRSRPACARCTSTRAATTGARASHPDARRRRRRRAARGGPRRRALAHHRPVDHRRRRRAAPRRTSAAGASCPTACSLNVAEEGWRELGELLAERGVWIEAGLFAPGHPERLAASRAGAALPARARRAAGDRAARSPSPPPARSTACSSARASSCRSCTTASTSPRGRCSTPPSAASARSASASRTRCALPDARRAGSNAELVAAAVERYGVSSSG